MALSTRTTVAFRFYQTDSTMLKRSASGGEMLRSVANFARSALIVASLLFADQGYECTFGNFGGDLTTSIQDIALHRRDNLYAMRAFGFKKIIRCVPGRNSK